MKKDLSERFEKYGALDNVTVKKSKNGEYFFAFVEYKRGENGEEAAQKYLFFNVDSMGRRLMGKP